MTRNRKTSTARGYGAAHQRERARWAPRVATGTVACARCQILITFGQAWDLGHPEDRTAWTGPEHATCNRSAGGVNAAAVTNFTRTDDTTLGATRDW